MNTFKAVVDMRNSWLKSSVLVFGRASIHALLRSPLTVQVESLLEDGRLEDAEELLDTAAVAGAQVRRIHVAPHHRLIKSPSAGGPAVSTSVYRI